MYVKKDDQLVEAARFYVELGTGAAFEPDDIHNIRPINGATRTFRYYGKVLADLEGIRTFFC